VQEVCLSDQLYQEAKRRATDAGFLNVDDFVADVLQHDFSVDVENFDDRFTPEVNAYLKGIIAEMEAGKSLSLDEAERNLDFVRSAWRKNAS
jgi:hypothetical protein